MTDSAPTLRDTQVVMRITPSRWLCIWIALVSAGAVVLCAAYLSTAGAIVAGIVLAALGIHAVLRDALLILPQSIVALRIEHSTLGYQLKNGRWHAADAAVTLRSSFVSRWLCVVTISSPESAQRRHVVLMPDSLSSEKARLTRRWLKWVRRNTRDPADQ